MESYFFSLKENVCLIFILDFLGGFGKSVLSKGIRMHISKTSGDKTEDSSIWKSEIFPMSSIVSVVDIFPSSICVLFPDSLYSAASFSKHS